MKKILKKLSKVCIKVILNFSNTHLNFVVLIGDNKLKKDKKYKDSNYKYYWLIKIGLFKTSKSLFLFDKKIFDLVKTTY